MDLSVIIPCLNEESTIGLLLDRLLPICDGLGISYEILVVDNGSTDSSKEIIEQYPVRLLECPHKGYGNALRYGLDRGTGTHLVFFDSDLSYHPEELPALYGCKDEGDIVIGSRLKGQIERGAMPWMHQYIGTPILTFLLNLYFPIRISDCNSGFRLMSRWIYQQMDLQTTGMEFVSEITIKAALLKASVVEIPITYSVDQRNRKPHLRTFRDGWRHLRLMLMYTPFDLFAVPGLGFLLLGLVLIISQFPLVLSLFGYTYGYHVAILGGTCFFIGLQLMFFYLCTHLLIYNRKFFPEETWFPKLIHRLQTPHAVVLSCGFFLLGLVLNADVLFYWIFNNFGPMDRGFQVILGVEFMTLGIQLGFSSLFASFITFSREHHGRE